MLIELHGGQFANKGANKMLLTTIKEIGGRLSGADFVVDACVGTPAQRADAGVETLFFQRGWMGQRFFRSRLRAQANLGQVLGTVPALTKIRIPVHNVSALIDLAGFAYSDQWGYRATRDFSRLAEYYHRQNKPVVLLPQALGPFQIDSNAESFRRVSKAADIIFARDQQSFDFAKNAATPDADLRQCPDITVPEGVTFNDANADRAILLVPNVRIVDQGAQSEDRYLNAFASIAEGLGDQYPVRIMVHDETGDDEALADKLNARLPTPIEVRRESDPWKIKQEIAESCMVIGSRYHSLVAALSCGVPCIAIGWSHKYAELMADCDSDDCLFSLDGNTDAFLAKARQFSDVSQNQTTRLKLRKIAETKAKAVHDMWDEVAEVLTWGNRRHG